jgi:hypothetical protein
MAGLPMPGSEELRALVPTKLHREIYRVLYESRDNPRSMQEMQEVVRASLGNEAAEQVHFSKRLRELRDNFEIRVERDGSRYTYRLLRRKVADRKPSAQISNRLRARVLRHQLCAQCGRTPTRDGVRLHVDHKIPREWGGPSEEWNLQALCSDCNEGKKAYYATFDGFTDEIRAAIAHEGVHERIGELLKAFDFADKETPDELLEVVAEARGRQRYWEKRMRELRHLGWVFTPRMYEEDGVRKTAWKLQRWEPWPAGGISAEIRRQTSRPRAGARQKQ